MSGFTTTGASVLTQLESIPHSIHFWRALTNWFGGMGVLVLCVAILPFLGVGGMQIFRAEMPGPSKDRLTPRITTTAKLLWGVYLLLSISEALLLRFVGGMGWFDAVCHTFTTMATGGFSTRSASIGAFDSVAVDDHYRVYVFSRHQFFTALSCADGKPGRYFKDAEFRFYGGLLLIAIFIVSIHLFASGWDTFLTSLRHAHLRSSQLLRQPDFQRQILISGRMPCAYFWWHSCFLRLRWLNGW